MGPLNLGLPSERQPQSSHNRQGLAKDA